LISLSSHHGFAGMLASVLLLALTAQPVAAVDGSARSSQDAGPPDAQLQQDQAELAKLDGQLKQSQARLDGLNQKLATDQQSQTQLQNEIESLARLQYEQPAFTLDRVLNARSLEQLLTNIAQSQVVSRKQEDLVKQSKELRRGDEIARDKAAQELAQVKAARAKAAQLAEQALGLQDGRAQAVAAQAASLACDPSQGGAAGCPTGSVQQIITGAFQSQGQAAVAWGLRIANCESGYNPRARNPSGASGLFQFMPQTFANTPPGRAGGSIWDPLTSSQAAAWMYSQGRQSEWQCK
jgi:soluble lytic murein transglycosylase-like protein